MKKLFALLLAMALLLTCVSALAAEKIGTDEEWRANMSDAAKGIYVEGLSEEEIAALTETTIIKDEASPTGYYVTFRHYAPDAKRVRIRGEWSFYQTMRNSAFLSGPYDPQDWQEGMFPLQVNIADWPAYDMEKNEATGVWYYTIPLYSGTWSYRFIENGIEGAALTDYKEAFQTTDVNNRPFEKALNDQGNSQVRVPYDEKQGASDFSVQLPRTDEKVGVTEIWTYDVEGVDNLRGTPSAAVYLPYGYDANREEPYKVLYISHGGGQESETSWYNKGSLPFITDNLIAEGQMEPIVVVILNNYALQFNEDSLIKDLIPLVEENYNVCKDAAGKALAGLSMGSMFTGRVMEKYPEEFSAYGRFSGAGGKDFADSIGSTTLYLAGGYYDFTFEMLHELAADFDSHGWAYGENYFFGGHDWPVWRLCYEDFVTNYLWK